MRLNWSDLVIMSLVTVFDVGHAQLVYLPCERLVIDFAWVRPLVLNEFPPLVDPVSVDEEVGQSTIDLKQTVRAL